MRLPADNFRDCMYVLWRNMTNDGQRNFEKEKRGDRATESMSIRPDELADRLEAVHSFDDFWEYIYTETFISDFYGTIADFFREYGIMNDMTDEDYEFMEREDMRDLEVCNWLDQIIYAKSKGVQDDQLGALDL